MGLLDSVVQGAWKTKLRGELALLDREITRKEAAFGVEFFDMICAYRNGMDKNLPSICDFVEREYTKAERAINLLKDEKEIKSLKIRINQTVADDTPPEKSMSDTANEAMLRLQMHSLDRDMMKRKEEFGNQVSREVAEKARFWSSSGVSARKANDMLTIRKLMEGHSRDLLAIYHERDNKIRTLHSTDIPDEASPRPAKQIVRMQPSKQSATPTEYQSLTRLKHYLERTKTVSSKEKSQTVKAAEEQLHKTRKQLYPCNQSSKKETILSKKQPTKLSSAKSVPHDDKVKARRSAPKQSSRSQSVKAPVTSVRPEKALNKSMQTTTKDANSDKSSLPKKPAARASKADLGQRAPMAKAKQVGKAPPRPSAGKVAAAHPKAKRPVVRVRVEI